MLKSHSEHIRLLLATSCFTLVSSQAGANTVLIVEGTAPAPADFPNVAPGYLLPLGTNTVDGQLNASSDQIDFFEFQGLAPGHNFSIHSQYNPLNQEKSMKMFVFTSTGTLLGSATLEGSGATVSGTIPGDGKLVVEETFGPRLGPIGSPTYQAALTAEMGLTITEKTAPAPYDFPGALPGYVLPNATMFVSGTISSNADVDCFEFQGLSAGTTFTLSNSQAVTQGLKVTAYDSSNNQLASGSLEGAGSTLTGTTPTDGLLVVKVAHDPASANALKTGNYLILRQ